MPGRRRRASLAGLLVLIACAPGAPGGGASPATVAEAWVTTPDRSRLLAREPDLPIITAGAVADTSVAVIDVDRTTVYQEMIGFGAAFTDASAYLIEHRLGARRQAILQELFGRNPGLGLSFMRVPIGASDFSMQHYSFDDRPTGETDTALTHFSIARDRVEKLPVIRAALAINPRIAIVASPWSAPGWMKSSGSLVKGTLRPEYYPAFAAYLHRFVEAYAAEGVPIFALTLQNEPAFEPDDYPGMRLDPPARATLVGRHLGPLLRRRGSTTRILEWDHNWDQPEQPLAVLADSIARRYVDGVAWHCYGGTVDVQSRVHTAFPGTNAYFTECSGGGWATDFGDNLRFDVGTLIIGATRGWARGVALWNLALDEQGGPHLGGCGNCRGVITIDHRTGAVTRNVEYYALAHASAFVRPGAHRIASSTDVRWLQSVAFRNADDGTIVLIVLNTGRADVPLAVHDAGRRIRAVIPAGAAATLRWR